MGTTTVRNARDLRGITPWRRFDADATRYFSADEIAAAKAYQRPLHVANAIDKVLTTIVAVAIVGGHVVPELLDSWGIESWVVGIFVAMAVVMLSETVVSIPIVAWRELGYEKRSGMSSQTVGGFVADLFKGLAVGVVVLSIILIPVWALIRSTSAWWLWGWLVMVGFSVVMLVLYPVVLAPIFNKFKPLDDGELRSRLMALAAKADADISEIQVADASRRTRRDNAYVAGLGMTRQVVMFDNLLERPAPMIESVVGHEIGHWMLGHLKRTLPLAIAALFVNFALLKLILESGWVLDFAGVDSLGDPGAVPVFLLVFPALSSLTGLATKWLTRAHERDADLYALELTGEPETFVETMRTLHADNKADLDPPWWRAVMMSHPPAAERMAMGEAWASAGARD
jgi:STE24 endopeptidase